MFKIKLFLRKLSYRLQDFTKPLLDNNSQAREVRVLVFLSAVLFGLVIFTTIYFNISNKPTKFKNALAIKNSYTQNQIQVYLNDTDQKIYAIPKDTAMSKEQVRMAAGIPEGVDFEIQIPAALKPRPTDPVIKVVPTLPDMYQENYENYLPQN